MEVAKQYYQLFNWKEIEVFNMEKLKENFGSILMFLGEIIVGILLLINPLGFTKTIIIGAGIFLTVMGILKIIKYFKTSVLETIKEHPLSSGLILTTLGLFCVFWSDWFIATFPVLTVIYGVIILLTGLKKIEWTANAFRLKNKYWYINGINALITIIFAIVVINNPFSTITFLWQFTGVILIIESIFDIVSIVFEIKEDETHNQINEKNDKQLKELLEDNDKEE